jgi:hypothetical protein
MPDWTYRTLFRAPLMRLPLRTARGLALGGLGTLAKFPGGVHVVDFFGHMRPPADLAVTVNGVKYLSPVGLGPRLDPSGSADPALARFGVGWIEHDCKLALVDEHADLSFSLANETVHWQLPAGAMEDLLVDHAPLPYPLTIPRWVRLTASPLHAKFRTETLIAQILRQFATGAAAITLDVLPDRSGLKAARVTEWSDAIAEVVRACRASGHQQPLYLVVPLDLPLNEFRDFSSSALAAGVSGFLVDNLECAAPLPAKDQCQLACALIAKLREAFGPDITIIAAAGIHSSAEAIECWQAGATLVQVDTGLMFAGPGLPKRVNEARRFYQTKRIVASPASRPSPLSPALPRSVEQAWFWLLLLGLSMFGGGLLAGAIAATRVVLPYDEAYLGLSRAEIAAINPRLLLFMAHDRVTLAGTMLAIGVFYSFLAWHAVRGGSHWAWLTILCSALAGFASFFLFLFFGYFDPFHALVTAILFQLLLAGWQGKLDPPVVPPFPNLRDTLAWRLSQWGQLLFVAQGVALLVGGAVICYVGSTTVFVPEDLEFLQTSREVLVASHPRLVPVVAHDRASFGGMLIACGLATLLSAMWGFRQGDSWQWWMYALASSLAYGSTLAVHYAVGYHSGMHLAPAFTGWGLAIVGLVLSYPYLLGLDIEHFRRWKQLLNP